MTQPATVDQRPASNAQRLTITNRLTVLVGSCPVDVDRLTRSTASAVLVAINKLRGSDQRDLKANPTLLPLYLPPHVPLRASTDQPAARAPAAPFPPLEPGQDPIAWAAAILDVPATVAAVFPAVSGLSWRPARSHWLTAVATMRLDRLTELARRRFAGDLNLAAALVVPLGLAMADDRQDHRANRRSPQ